METVSSGKQSISRDRGISGGNVGNVGNVPNGPNGPNGGGYPMRPRASTDRASARNGNGTSIKSVQDSTTPHALPKGFDSMLKTTTETGDIGLFSIKPSRLPPTSNTPRRIGGPQRPRPNFQPYGVPVVDDRKRLPSYMRDGSSEAMSVYDSTSQKSGSRGFEDPDYRSYSMTQTSNYSAYTLSNHKSYASLRSQQDGGAAMLQRPRSPFAYPTRLRRPGFRPSSPALTDGGGVDYSRRAEIDRIPYGASRNASSPSSLYALKRVPPPLSLRPEGNRSTPSLLSQTSPKRRTPSPNLRQGNVMTSQDWQRRTGPSSISTSPARSILSLASTGNLGPIAASQSGTNTPGKPSPRYYDYTEDFDVENDSRAELPPQFQLQRTIHEDRPLSSALLPLNKPNGYRPHENNNHLRTSSSASTIFRQSMRNYGPRSDSPANDGGRPRQLSGVDNENIPMPQISSPDVVLIEKSSIDLSTLGANAQELSSRVSRAFGLVPSPSFEITSPDSGSEETRNADSKYPQKLSTSAPALSLSTHLSACRSMDDSSKETTNDSSENVAVNLQNQFPQERSGSRRSELLSDAEFSALPMPFEGGLRRRSRSNSAHIGRARSSGFYSISTGIADLADLLTSYEETGRPATSGNGNTGKMTPMLSPTLPNESFSMGTPSLHSPTPPPTFQRTDNDSSQGSNTEGSCKDSSGVHRGGRGDLSKILNYRSSEVHSFGIQIPSKIMPRSESPMLAPKPISPARQLKLKNSVPQLMKALPALPDQSFGSSTSGKSNSRNVNLPCHFSTILPDAKFSPIHETGSNERPATVANNDTNSMPETDVDNASSVQDQELEQTEVSSDFHPSPIKMKLRVRNSATGAVLPQESRALNQETNYPSTDQRPELRLSKAASQPHMGDARTPRLKLKLSRTAEPVSPGTVRVNKDFGDQTLANTLNIRHPKDLFTPSGGLDNIFRQVGKHIHARRASANSEQALDEESTEAPPGTISGQSSSNRPSDLDLSVPFASPTSGNLPSPSDARSFFSDDSSHCHGNHSIRKRISNFRARVGVPYAARNGSYSCDDVVWRDQNSGSGQIPLAVRSITDLEPTGTSLESTRPRQSDSRLHAQRLRAKVTEWLRGARAAISARVKSRSTTSRSDLQTGTSA